MSLCQSSVNQGQRPLTAFFARHTVTSMQDIDFDKLLTEYRGAVDTWVAAIEAEEALANDDHSMVEMEKWDAAALAAQDAENKAKKAREHYKNALRRKNYGF
jgi:hypothetical protein